ncbi:MAG: (d)CMP kinase [Pseudomonadota bacterium]|nr:(d)CMP kinase [Pseudomonadota bacterium]
MKSNSTYIITIDGTSGSGKTTISRSLAKKLSFSLLDSGKLYRSAGFIYLQSQESFSDMNSIKELISKITMSSNSDSNEYEIFYDNKKIDNLLYSEEVSESASIVSKIPEVRECMMKIQKLCVKGRGLIANGRDMGTEVFPEANLKLYVNASLEIRAKRRYEELKSKGEDVNLENIYKSLQKRDESDTNRTISPLRVPNNAEIIDTSDLKPDAIVDKILNLYTITKN